MKVLLTGADGLLGSNLVRVLLQRGHAVRVLLWTNSSSKTLDGLDIERHYGDILSPETLDPAVSGCDAVIHAAAMTNIWPQRSEQIRRVNIEGTRNIIDAVLRKNIGRMIYVGSASSVNARAKGEESSSFPGARFKLDYIDSKYEALNLVLGSVRDRGLPAIAILPTFMIGPYDSLPSSGKMILQVVRGRMKFYTRGGRNFVYVNDVANAIANSLTEGRIGKYYITGNENLTYREFFGKTAGIVNRPKPFISVPDWLIISIGYLGTMTGKIFGKEPLITFPMAKISCEKQFVSSDEAVSELHMPVTRIETAIHECYKWFIDNHYVK
jgi:dihydroflavonol-4-reductase